MNCRRAKLEIALWVGDDLDSRATDGLKRHLTECAPCRTHWQKLKLGLKPLQNSGSSVMFSIDDSLWPSLLTQLPDRPAEPQPTEFNGWLPAVAVCAACLAIVAFWQQNRFQDHSSAEMAENSPIKNVFPKNTFSKLVAGNWIPDPNTVLFLTPEKKTPVPLPIFPFPRNEGPLHGSPGFRQTSSPSNSSFYGQPLSPSLTPTN